MIDLVNETFGTRETAVTGQLIRWPRAVLVLQFFASDTPSRTSRAGGDHIVRRQRDA